MKTKRNTFARVLVALAVSTIFLISLQARPGDLDPTFGKLAAPGVRTFTLTNWFQSCCISQQADGKLLVAGMLGGENSGSVDGRLILRRHLVTNGNLDSTFGMGGEAVASGPYPAYFVWGRPKEIAVQPDGKILVAGVRADGKPVIWRFTTAGQLDTTFGDEGVLALSNLNGAANGVVFSNGKILAVESISSSTDYLLRRNTNGSPDSTFGFLGFISLPAGGPTAFAVDPLDGSMYVTYSAYGAYEGFVGRILANGSIDSEFGVGGLITIPFSQCAAGFLNFSEVEVQTDGKILVVGNSWEPPYGNGPFVFRFSSAGEYDTSFGTAGRLCLETGLYTDSFHQLPRIARQSNGKIVTLAYDSAYPALKRINSDSSTDTTFQPSYSTDGYSYDVLVQNGDGKVVILATLAVAEAEVYKLIRFLP